MDTGIDPINDCCACVRAKLLQSYLTLHNLINHSPPGSSVHGILQAGILHLQFTSRDHPFASTLISRFAYIQRKL